MLEEQATRVEELLAKLGDTESKQEEDEVRSAWNCYYRCMDVCTSPVGSIHRRQKWGVGHSQVSVRGAQGVCSERHIANAAA